MNGLTRLGTTFFLIIITSSIGCVHIGPPDTRFDLVSYEVDGSAELANVFEALPATNSELNEPKNVIDLVGLALNNNPEIEEAKLVVESLSHRPLQAYSLPDPQLGTTTHLSQVQTAAGQQDFAISVNQKFIRQNKRITKAQVAQDELDVARAKLATVEQKVVTQVKKTFFELVFIQETISILESDRKQLQLIDAVIDKRFRVLKDVTQQETLQIQVAISKLESEIDDFRQLKRSLQARLARLVHVSPETEIVAQTPKNPANLNLEFESMLQIAIEQKPELHAQLYEIRKNRNATSLAELSHQPDFSLGLNWIMTSDNGISPVANGRDAVLLTWGMNLPIYRDRIDAGVRESQVRTLANTKKYERLKDETAESITDLFVKFNTTSKNLNLFKNDIIPKQKLTLDQSLKNYEVGKTDYLQMIDNWRKLLQFQIMEKRFESDLRKTLADLEKELGISDIDQIQ